MLAGVESGDSWAEILFLYLELAELSASLHQLKYGYDALMNYHKCIVLGHHHAIIVFQNESRHW